MPICSICRERSTWDFLRDFYSKVEASQLYASALENDLKDVRYIATQYEASLNSLAYKIHEERSKHRETQEELYVERLRHQETKELLQKTFHEARRSGQLADVFASELALRKGLPCKENSVLVDEVTQRSEQDWCKDTLAFTSQTDGSQKSPSTKRESGLAGCASASYDTPKA
jgi:predicted RNase H-like nuclease (RuvC/YqgF family)